MSNVQQARVEFGARLRGLRRGANLTGRALARQAGWDISRVSRYELGRQLPPEADVRTWCQLTDSALHIPDLIASLRNIDAAHLEWKRMSSRRLQRRTGIAEAEARLIRGYDGYLVPGLLQTRDYAAAVLGICIEFVGSPEDLDAAVEERMTRQKALRRKGRECHVILAEQALYTKVGDGRIMSAQLEHLLKCTRAPGIHLGLIPRDAEFITPITSFFMYDTNDVLVDTMSSSITISQPSEVALYEKGFQRLNKQAHIGEPARELIRVALAAHRARSDAEEPTGRKSSGTRD